MTWLMHYPMYCQKGGQLMSKIVRLTTEEVTRTAKVMAMLERCKERWAPAGIGGLQVFPKYTATLGKYNSRTIYIILINGKTTEEVRLNRRTLEMES